MVTAPQHIIDWRNTPTHFKTLSMRLNWTKRGSRCVIFVHDGVRYLQFNRWQQGHYRVATALASLHRYTDAAEAFERALALNPTDNKLQQQLDEMRTLATKEPQAVPAKRIPTTGETATSVSTKVFSGGIIERPVAVEEIVNTVGSTAPTSTVRHSRFVSNKPGADVVTLEPVGEAVRENIPIVEIIHCSVVYSNQSNGFHDSKHNGQELNSNRTYITYISYYTVTNLL